MARNRQRELALAAIAVMLVAVAVWSTQRSEWQRPDSTAAPAPTVPSATVAQPPKPGLKVDLEALEAGRPEPEESSRNPFRFKPAPAPPRPPALSPQQQQQAKAAAAGPLEPPPPPRIALKYIGDMTDPARAGKRIAILSDDRGVYYGREGEVIEGRYRIVRIGVESVELAYLDGRGRQTIRQTGQ